MITINVTTVTASRVVQFMPRLTHHISAQLMTTGMMISSCNQTSQMTRMLAAAANADADGAADSDAGFGTLDPDETRTVDRAGIAGAGTFQGQLPGGGCGLAGLLGQRRLGER